MKWYNQAIRQYADFNGRARRKEYWMFKLINFLFYFLLIIIAIPMLSVGANDETIALILGLSFVVYGIFITIPALAVTVRRLHDSGNSGWMILVSLIPMVGWIWLLILLTTEGEYGENEYGYDPKEELQEEF